MIHSLNSLKGGYIGIIYGTILEVSKGDTRSLDNGSHDSREEATSERSRKQTVQRCTQQS